MSWGLLQGIGRCREHFEQELERLGLTFEEVEARCRYPVG